MNSRRWLSILFLLLFIVIVAGRNLNSDSVRLSELNSIRHTGFLNDQDYTPEQTVDSVRVESPQHPPLYFVLLTAWSQLIAIHPMMLRIVSLYFALLLAAFTYRLGATVNQQDGGLIALFFLTFSAFYLFYAHEIRAYTMLAFTSALVVWAYWRVINVSGPVHWTRWLWLYTGSVWCIYVHYFGLFPLIGIGIYHLVFVSKSRRWLQIAFIEVLAGLTFLPWIPVVIFGSNNRIQLVSDSQNIIEVIYRHFFVYGNSVWWLALGLCILALSLAWTQRKQQPYHLYLMVVGVVSLVSIIGLNELSPVIPIRRMRYTMVWSPLITLMMTIGMVQLRQWRWLQVIVGVVWVGSMLWMNQSSDLLDYTGVHDQYGEQYPNFQLIVDGQDTLPGNGEMIVSVAPDAWVYPEILNFYEKLTDYSFFHLTDNVTEFDIDMRQFQINRMEGIRRSFSFWVLYTPMQTDLESIDIFQATVTETFRSCYTAVDTPTVRLDYYVRYDIPCDLTNKYTMPHVLYDNGIKLLDYKINQQDEDLIMYSWWDNQLDDSYGFSLQVYDSGHNKVAQGDFFLPPETIQKSVLNIAHLPTGTYRAMLILYDIATVNSVDGIDQLTGGEFGREFDAGTIDIVTSA